MPRGNIRERVCGLRRRFEYRGVERNLPWRAVRGLEPMTEGQPYIDASSWFWVRFFGAGARGRIGWTGTAFPVDKKIGEYLLLLRVEARGPKGPGVRCP